MFVMMRCSASASQYLPWALSVRVRLLRVFSVSGCSGPSTRSWMAKTARCSASASAYLAQVLKLACCLVLALVAGPANAVNAGTLSQPAYQWHTFYGSDSSLYADSGTAVAVDGMDNVPEPLRSLVKLRALVRLKASVPLTVRRIAPPPEPPVA